MWDIKRPKESICPVCGNDSLELYDEANIPQRYKGLLKLNKNRKEVIGQLSYNHSLSHFRCSRCKRKFGISWVLGYPVPYH